MALVSYDNSDSSDFDDDEGDSVTLQSIHSSKVPAAGSSTTSSGHNGLSIHDDIFKLLPPTNQKYTVEEDDEFLHKKATTVKQKAKITVPSLSEFKDVENSIPNTKPRAGSEKKSGLLSILPEPKNAVKTTTKSLIPNVLTQKLNTTTSKKKLPLKAATQVSKSVDEEDSDDEEETDFFSINKKHDIPPEEPLDTDMPSDTVQIKRTAEETIRSYFKDPPVPSDVDIEQNVDSPSSSACEEMKGEGSSTGNELELDDEAIRQLCGSRGRRKKEDIQLVHVDQGKVLADARQWLMKGLMEDTSKRVSSSKRKGNEPTNQQKRKHQITYLAHQAKANEVELQNQWANSRMSRRQTQSKYGF